MASMDLDEFLGHSSTERRSGGGSRVLNWKKRTPARIDTWLHTQGSIIALWRHGWPRVVEREKEGTKTIEVWGGNFNCWEHEDTLRRQHRRDDDGNRISPPRVCPLCMMTEYVRQQVKAGKIDWLQPIFEFKGDDPEKNTILTATGLYNGFGDDLSRQEVAEMRRAGIARTDAWRQNVLPKCNYLFSIVDNDEIEKGVQTCIETTALGEAVKRVIRDQIESLGERDGHPLRSPYAIRWEYKPQEQKFSDKYRALPMPRLELTPEIRELITGPAPDVSEHINRGNLAALRASMESHALIDMPWDQFFAAAEAEEGASSKSSKPTTKAAPAPTKAKEEEPEAAPAVRRRGAPAKAEPQEPTWPAGTTFLPCDACGAKMADTDPQCWKCGAKYEIDDAPAAKPAKAASKNAVADESDDGEVGF